MAPTLSWSLFPVLGFFKKMMEPFNPGEINSHEKESFQGQIRKVNKLYTYVLSYSRLLVTTSLDLTNHIISDLNQELFNSKANYFKKQRSLSSVLHT